MFKRQRIDEVSPHDARDLHRQGAVLLDVREDQEWAAGHAPEAVHVRLADVHGVVSRFAGRPVLAVCRSGSRSTKAAQRLAAAGIEVRNVAGGMASWAAAGLPVVRDDGSPGGVA